MNTAVIYIHGQGGNAEEAAHYQPLFPNREVIGWDYQSQAPWEAAEEFSRLYHELDERYDSVILIANSIGAYFAMNAVSEKNIEKAFFISPVVDMERLITDMMTWANVTEEELQQKETIETAFGQTLSWEYLSYVRAHPLQWKTPTHVLYGGHDTLTSLQTITDFTEQTGSSLTIMENGEHWFHTQEQMEFLDRWILSRQ